MQRVIVHIDQLVLKGFRHEDRHAFAANLQEELTRQLAEPDAIQNLMASGGLPRLKVGAEVTGLEFNAGRVGKATARGIVKGIKQ